MESSSGWLRPSVEKPISELPAPLSTLCAQVAASGEYRLRPWSINDAERLVGAWADAEIARWNPVPPDATLEFAMQWIIGTHSQTVASIGIDVVMVDSDDLVAGEVGFQIDPAQGVAEFGFWLASDRRGLGLGPVLLELAARLAHELELAGLVALTDAANDRAIATLIGNGWVEVPTTSSRRAFALRIA